MKSASKTREGPTWVRKKKIILKVILSLSLSLTLKLPFLSPSQQDENSKIEQNWVPFRN